MATEKNTGGGKDKSNDESQTLRPETEAGKAGGVQPAREKAERDWEDSAKEDGE